MAKSMSIKLEFVAPLPQIAITRFTYNAVEFYGPQGPRYKEVDLCLQTQGEYLRNCAIHQIDGVILL